MMNSNIKITLAMMIWGTIGLFVVWSGLDSMTISFFRCLLGAIILLLFMNKSSYEEFKLYNYKDYSLMMLSGVCLVLNWIFLFKSFQLASITIGNIAYYMQPIFLVLLGIVFFQEKVPLLKWCFILLTFFGIVIAIDVKECNLHNFTFIGAMYAMLAGLLYAIATIIVKMQKNINPHHMTFMQLIIGLLLLLPFLSYDSIPSTFFEWKYIVIIGVVHTAIAYLLYYSAVKNARVTSIAVISYIDPLVAILTDILFFNRHLNVLQWLGIGLALWASYRVITFKCELKTETVLS